MGTSSVPDGRAHARVLCVVGLLLLSSSLCLSSSVGRKTENFGKNWKFALGDVTDGQRQDLDDSQWRRLDLPHDWSIEGTFSDKNPATPGGGALPGGIGWYRKTFTRPEADKARRTFVEFDGVYKNSTVWINGHLLGLRPYGYSSFEYELTPYLHSGKEKNVLAVRVDNSQQPNSRYYSGSGIYRNVWLTTTENIRVDHWGTFITTPHVSKQEATVAVRIWIRNTSGQTQPIRLIMRVIDGAGREVAKGEAAAVVPNDSVGLVDETLKVRNPSLWSLEHPNLYRAVAYVRSHGKTTDTFATTFGIRTFAFDAEKGFSLNGMPVKIRGVCEHHDLGCLGAAVNIRALERQIEILKAVGVNALRTSHNPPAPELLDLCDKMGIIVMDEAFDMWKKSKKTFDYSLDWDEWHRRDLADLVVRDRNHPSVFLWSIGNEVQEQYDHTDSSGSVITKELASIVRDLDPSRPITSACNDADPMNPIIRSGALDVIGENYNISGYPLFPTTYPGKKFIATETTSALATRGHYDMPSDSIRRWPSRWDLPLLDGNPDNTCSSYDNCSVPWGSTHEETWKIIKKYDFLSGLFIWTGFDYLGEPTPYGWPSRSSYFGLVDLAGFPKDAYYLYQSEWTDTPVLHVFPHWNWKPGQTIDVWAYTNFEEVELFLNGTSLGVKKKTADDLHLQWRLTFAPGTLKAVGRSGGKDVLVREVKTAGAPAMILLGADRTRISANGEDLSFVSVKVLDAHGTLVPNADNLIRFSISGVGRIVGVDNGLQSSSESFKATEHKAFNGLCLAVIRSTEKAGRTILTATADGLPPASVVIESR